jgi:tetratricopeptide (TPR) repeat protein
MALPPSLSDFTGRKDELDVVAGLAAGRLGRNPVVVIWGQPGVGKSQLALQAAHRLLADHGDGACLIDLQGYSDNRLSAEQAAARILELLAPDRGVPGSADARYAAVRDVLRSGRYVVVLDNAGDPGQVRDLLPGPCESIVLVTSRSSLATLDAALVELDVLDAASAIALLRLMAEREGGSPRGSEDEYRELVRICGHLPLALRIAGALLRARPSLTVGRLTARLADENRRLGLLQRDDLAVRPVFESSHAVLDEPARRLFALLGSVAAVRIAPWTAAALLDTELPDAEDLLERLVDAQLLRASGTDGSGAPRFTFHDLVRLYAREKLREEITPDELAAAEERLFSGYLAVTLSHSADHPVSVNFDFARTVPRPWAPAPEDLPKPAEPMDWLVEERADIVAEIEHAYATRHWRYVWGLADILHAVFILSSHGPESHRVKELALAAARAAGDETAELEARFHLNSLLHYEFRYEEAVAELGRQREARRARGEARRVAHLDLIMGVVQRDGGMLRAAHESLARSMAGLEALPDRDEPAVQTMIASARQNLAVVFRDLGRLRETDELLARCLAAFERYDDAIAFVRALHTRVVLRFYLGRYDEAEADIERAAELVRGVGDRRWAAILLLARARLALRRSDWEPAFRMLDECDDLFRAIADQAGHAQVHRSRAVALRGRGRFDEAEAAFAAAHEGLKAVHDRRSHARLHYSMALMGVARQDWAAALDQLGQASRLFTVDDDAVWRCRVRVLRARIPGQEEGGLREELDAFAALAGEGYLPLWIAEARRWLDERP